MSDLNLGVIGNCAYTALIDPQGRIVWSCLPRFDGDPVFCSLLKPTGTNADHGLFEIAMENLESSDQFYRDNSAVLVTRLRDTAGAIIEITDFAPRFRQFGRIYRPTQIVRIVRPVTGQPRITIRLRPLCDNGAAQPETTRGSNHIRYVVPGRTLRLTTDAPVTYVAEETPFIVNQELTLILGPDESLAGAPHQIGNDHLDRTLDYWRDWVRYLSLPFEWQREVIRAAITLKLSNFEETGAIVAAMTTSIPEAAGTVRNWDYRFCWLRDAYFVVHALNRLGATRTMEHYLNFISNLIAEPENFPLQPVYGIATESDLTESTVETLAGYRGMGPVRVGNQAYEQTQNDVFGAVVMGLTQIFFDLRLDRRGDAALFRTLEPLGEQALELFDKPDAGLWELRGRQHVHTFSSAMCWAAADRLAKIATHLGMEDRARYWREAADRMHATICEQSWNADENCFDANFEDGETDAALLLLADIGFVAADDPRFIGTVASIERRLRRGDYMFRYASEDDFGMPENAFNICTFWYIDALAATGREDEARALFENMLHKCNHLGLLSEDLDPRTGEMWGNFPQTYSMVGLINSAMRLSRSWEEAL